MSDLIERQKAIEVADAVWCVTGDVNVAKVWDQLKNLPSAQPEIEERKEESAQNVPKEDLISRKAAIDAALSAFSRGLLASPDIRKLPSVQPEPQWIPVSERLPEEGQSILVTTTNGWYVVAIIRTFFKDIHKDIIAWMPLPEPYMAERRTDETD